MDRTKSRRVVEEFEASVTGARHLNLHPPGKIETVLGAVVALVAAGYAAQLGFELDDGDRDLYYYTNLIVAGLFLLETCVTIVLRGKSYFFGPRRLLHVADCAITAVAVLDAVFLILGDEYFLLRFFKTLKCFRCLWILSAKDSVAFALGVVERVGTNFLLVLAAELFVLYCNALLATKFIGGAAEFATDTIVRERYGNLTKSLSTLFQLCTFQMTWSESVGHVLREGSSYVTTYAWVVHVECILVFAYLWFVVVMGGVFKALQDEKRAEEEAEGARRQQSVDKAMRDFLKKNAGRLHGDEYLSDDDGAANGARAKGDSLGELKKEPEFYEASLMLGLKPEGAAAALDFLTDREGTVESYKARCIEELFTLADGVTRAELYGSAGRVLGHLRRTLKVQREDTEDLRHQVSVLAGLLQQNIQAAAKGEKVRVRNQEWFQEREQLKQKNERLAADLINVKRQMQAAKVEAAAARSAIGQSVKQPNLQSGIY